MFLRSRFGIFWIFTMLCCFGVIFWSHGSQENRLISCEPNLCFKKRAWGAMRREALWGEEANASDHWGSNVYTRRRLRWLKRRFMKRLWGSDFRDSCTSTWVWASQFWASIFNSRSLFLTFKLYASWPYHLTHVSWPYLLTFL